MTTKLIVPNQANQQSYLSEEMVDKVKVAGTLYMWTHWIEESQYILSNPHYSIDDAERFTDRYLSPNEERFLKERYLEAIEDESSQEQFQLTEEGKNLSRQVYDYVEEVHNGDLQGFIDWEDEEKIEDMLNQ